MSDYSAIVEDELRRSRVNPLAWWRCARRMRRCLHGNPRPPAQGTERPDHGSSYVVRDGRLNDAPVHRCSPELGGCGKLFFT